jgi:hypothetical protein
MSDSQKREPKDPRLSAQVSSADMDVALKGNIGLTALNRISMEIDDLLLPYTFDLAIYDRIENSGLLDHIARAGKTLYKKV